MHMIVHLDLKGAPLKIAFLERVLSSIKKWGATGILIEWEDSFPYTGVIANIGSLTDASGDGMYTVEEVKHILYCAKENELEVIQLVQTIGHMEFVLKHPCYRKCQEKARSPAVLCPSQTNSQELVRTMVLQALEIQPDAKYFHIGADEVWHTAVCIKCQYRAIPNNLGPLSLYLEHIRDLALFIKQQRPDLTILMWDDMLRSTSANVLQHYKLGELVQPVVWNYNVKADFSINPQTWDCYRTIFPSSWVASAFKGASGSCEVYPNTDRYVNNQEAWIDEVQKVASVNFAGVVLTGWSRYDHFATLCELLAVSMECLRSCLHVWNKFMTNSCQRTALERKMGLTEGVLGQEFIHTMKIFMKLRDRSQQLLHSDLVATWLNPWQIEHGYTNPAHLELIANESITLIRELTALRSTIQRLLATVTGSRSTNEWVGTFITPLLKKLTDVQDLAIRRYNIDASVKPI
ncbi:hexosaminidase D-like [Pararge aegeria]|uniref:hexosaminidase D-like n=1 Tax=Pararge aegeria TaxID=116150 RepID=UPI0019D2F515|nr:hexosaminidase D-like [Pararge aegeria]